MPFRKSARKPNGAALAEAAANTALLYPFLILVTFALIQASVILYLMYGLNQASREAAREAAIIYMKSGSGQTPPASVLNEEFARIVVPGVVNNANQFTCTWPSAYPKNVHPLLNVTVTCTAAFGQTGSNGEASNLGFPTGILMVNQLLKSTTSYPLRP